MRTSVAARKVSRRASAASAWKDEVVAVPRAEERARADDHRAGAARQDVALGRRLAGPVDVERRRRVALDPGASAAPVEHLVARERDETNAGTVAGLGEYGGAERVLAHAALAVGLGVVDAHVAARVDDRPRLPARDRGVDRVGVGDVHGGAVEESAGDVATRADRRERLAERAARAADEDRRDVVAGASGRKPASVVTVVRGTTGLAMKRSARRHQPSPCSTGWLAGLPAASSAISAASAVGRGSGARTSKGPGS
jgi:hypothetical protein